jgi:hypothetical protein
MHGLVGKVFDPDLHFPAAVGQNVELLDASRSAVLDRMQRRRAAGQQRQGGGDDERMQQSDHGASQSWHGRSATLAKSGGRRKHGGRLPVFARIGAVLNTAKQPTIARAGNAPFDRAGRNRRWRRA